MDGHPSLHTSNHLRRIFAVCLCIALVLSFGLHDAYLEHEHGHVVGAHEHTTVPEGENGGAFAISEYLHAMDRKLFLLVLSVFLFCTGPLTFFGVPKRMLFAARPAFIFATVSTLTYEPQRHGYLSDLFQRGILHNRHYG